MKIFELFVKIYYMFIFTFMYAYNQKRYVGRHLIFVWFVAFLILIIKRDKLSEYVNE